MVRPHGPLRPRSSRLAADPGDHCAHTAVGGRKAHLQHGTAARMRGDENFAGNRHRPLATIVLPPHSFTRGPRRLHAFSRPFVACTGVLEAGDFTLQYPAGVIRFRKIAISPSSASPSSYLRCPAVPHLVRGTRDSDFQRMTARPPHLGKDDGSKVGAAAQAARTRSRKMSTRPLNLP